MVSFIKQHWFKLVVVLILFLVGSLVFVLPYFKNENDLFEKKLSCSRLIPEVENKLNDQEKSVNDVGKQIGIITELDFLELFYSQKLQTCVYALHFSSNYTEEGAKTAEFFGGSHENINDFIIRDALTGANIFTFTLEKEEDFNTKIKELK